MRYPVKECDNRTQAHDLSVVAEDNNGMRVFCNLCKRQYQLRKKDGRFDNLLYSKLFYRMIVQPSKPLYYRIHKEKMHIV